MPYFDGNLRVGSRFCPLRGQKRSKSKKLFFPRNPHLAGLMMATKIFQFWPFWPKLLRFKVSSKFGTPAEIWVKCEPVGRFFWHFSLLVPARPGNNHRRHYYSSLLLLFFLRVSSLLGVGLPVLIVLRVLIQIYYNQWLPYQFYFMWNPLHMHIIHIYEYIIVTNIYFIMVSLEALYVCIVGIRLWFNFSN